MALVKTEGVILQSRPFSESSRILALFTLGAGRLSLLVKGGRKGTKKFPGGLETLNRVELQYYYRSGRELQNFKSSDLLESYPGLHRNLPRTCTALSLAETVLRTTAPDDPNPDLYRTLTTVLSTLNNQEQRPWAIRWKGLLDVCRYLGFGMTLDGCSRCGGREAMTGFDLTMGGFICKLHPKDEPNIIEASGEIWGTLRFLNRCPYEAAARIATHPAAGRRIETLFTRYFHYHIPALKHFESWKRLPEVYWGEEEV